MKTPLTHVAGEEETQGDPEWAEKLARWLRISESERDEAVTGVHGLHPYPGRMHPLWARRAIASLPADVSILDPFCGSGTVLVEARMADRHARGSDVNPIAVRLARLRCIPHAPAELIRQEAKRCADGCTKRRDTPFSALAEGEKSYPRHVLAGLISLRDEIEKTRDPRARELLLFSFSPLLDKLSARGEQAPPRVPRTAVRDLFTNRVEQWLGVFEVTDTHRFAEAEVADARWLPWKPGTSSAVITSPPYPGVYDYATAQERRARWLGDTGDALRTAKRKEFGRRGAAPDWHQAMGTALRQLCRTTKPGSPMWLVVGDGVMRGRVFRTDQVLIELTEKLPIEHVATASQARPHFHAQTAPAFHRHPRREHLVMLRRTDGPVVPLSGK